MKYPLTISEIVFANGIRLRIDQVAANGKCRVTDAADDGRVLNYTRDAEHAWSSVRYLAGISKVTERSRGAPDTDILDAHSTRNIA